jgi:hypothetical protein
VSELLFADKEILLPRDLGPILGKKPSQIYADIQAGLIPHCMLNGRIIIPKRALDSWLNGLADSALERVRGSEAGR